MSTNNRLSFVSSELGDEYREQVFVLSQKSGTGVGIHGKVLGVQDILKVLCMRHSGELKVPRSPKATVREDSILRGVMLNGFLESVDGQSNRA